MTPALLVLLLFLLLLLYMLMPSQSRADYRKLLKGVGLLEDDQDVYHIISSENGGADHMDNYHYAQNGSWNRAIGANHDYINCFLAGKLKSEKAVAISRGQGNSKGKRYQGPDASVLYKLGEDAMRELRATNRRTWAEIRSSWVGS
jgi:hypothetical protein